MKGFSFEGGQCQNARLLASLPRPRPDDLLIVVTWPLAVIHRSLRTVVAGCRLGDPALFIQQVGWKGPGRSSIKLKRVGPRASRRCRFYARNHGAPQGATAGKRWPKLGCIDERRGKVCRPVPIFNCDLIFEMAVVRSPGFSRRRRERRLKQDYQHGMPANKFRRQYMNPEHYFSQMYTLRLAKDDFLGALRSSGQGGLSGPLSWRNRHRRCGSTQKKHFKRTGPESFQAPMLREDLETDLPRVIPNTTGSESP